MELEETKRESIAGVTSSKVLELQPRRFYTLPESTREACCAIDLIYI